ncbi:MAG: hypothetical protein CME13_00190 [Gemmatimonadetes bacterium]|nr:hypothetical protein [Gemmatimonadota bacterium]HCV23642.1 hypothetical protein [Candidatus Latescibacterota bacterium]
MGQARSAVQVFLELAEREIGLGHVDFALPETERQCFDITTQMAYAVGEACLLFTQFGFLLVEAIPLGTNISKSHIFNEDRLLHAQDLVGIKVLDQQGAANTDNGGDNPDYRCPSIG